MNVAEGVLKVRRSGRQMILVSLSALTVYFCLPAVYNVFAWLFHSLTLSESSLLIIAVALFLCAVGTGSRAVLWMVGWLVDGFAEDTH